MKRYFGILVFISNIAFSQAIKFGTEPNQFLVDLDKNISKSLDNVGKDKITEFQSNFNSKLDSICQKQIISVFQFLSKKNLSPNDFLLLVETYNALQTKGNLNSQGIQSFSKVLSQSLENQNGKKITEAINTLYFFSTQNQIYHSNYSRIYTLNGDFSFGYSAVSKTSNIQTEIKYSDFGLGESKENEEYDPWNDPNLNVSNKKSINATKIPTVQGLLIEFKQVELHLAGPSDSLSIKKTSGVFDVLNGIFVGQGGEMVWQLNNHDLTANFEKYVFKVQGTKFLADNVSLNYPDKLKKPVLGVLDIRLEKQPKGIASTFPRFASYSNDAELKLNLNNYLYKGGLSLVGSKISSAPLDGSFTKITVNPLNINMFEVQGRNFEISDSLISSEKTSFKTKFDTDSVSHPAVKMRYDIIGNELHLNKIEHGGFRNSMYSDTFHQVDIKCDAMNWKLKNAKMDFYIVAGKNEIPAVFESFNYFNPERLRYLSSAAGFNPLFTAANIVAKKKVNEISLNDMQEATHLEKFQVSNGMLIGNQMGFFDYNSDRNTYSISRKGKHYYTSFGGKADFDDLVLISLSNSGSSENGNASIDLTSKSLDIKGTQDFKLSDSLGINFIPKGQSMQIIGNKVFTFNGQINIKNYKFYGDFQVEYEKFIVKLKRIDSISFIPLNIYKKGGKLELGSNMIFGKTGIIYLNSPDNKSGRKNLQEYPKLEIDQGAIVYFNEKARINKFDKELNFKISNIKIDSLNAVDPKFDGIFYSAGIFKPISETLKVVADSSLGLVHKPKGVYNIYGLASNFKTDADIILNNKGITSSGEISHLAAKLKTKRVQFFTDHLEAEGSKGSIVEGNQKNIYFPEIQFDDFKAYWKPLRDSMNVASPKAFNLYAGSSQLNGSLIVTEKGLLGTGILDRKDAETQSKQFTFNKSGFIGNHANFKIKSDAKPLFTGKNVDVDFNVLSENVKLAPNQTPDSASVLKSQLEFPYAAYITTIDKAVWNIKDKKITMTGLLENSMFQSTASNQFGLKFNGTGATYDLANLNLNISGVKGIHSADARIVPPKGLVAVNKDGMLEAFTNAKIIADTLNGYHVLTHANVKINSRISFNGNADYQFVNVKSDTFNIKMGNFEFAELDAQENLLNTKSTNKLSTIARAKVNEKDGVYLSPKILYRGEIIMKAPFKNLTLHGELLPDLKKYPMFGGNWINYSGNKSEEINIPIDETLKDGGKDLFVGLHILAGVVSKALYPTFLQAKKSEDDLDVFLAHGMFKRDEANKKFTIVPTKMSPNNNVYDFYDDKGIIAMEGEFNLLGAPSKIFETVGIANLKLDSMKYLFSTLMKIDFPLPIPTVQKLGQDIVKANLDAGNSDPAIVAESPYFLAKIAQYVGSKEAEEYRIKKLKEHQPLFKLSPKFLATMVFSDLNLSWNAKSNSYYSIGKVGISNIGDVDINAMTDAYVEIVKSPLTGDEINIFLDIAQNSWYYFSFKDGELNMTSSDIEVNKLISAPVAANGKEKKSNVNFTDLAEALRFKKRFSQLYLGISESAPAAIKSALSKPVTPKKAAEKDGF